MKKEKIKKILAACTMGIMTLLMPFALPGCTTKHEHSNIYEYNDYYHWYKCIDDNCNALFDLDKHEFVQEGSQTVMDTKTTTDYKCKCGFEKQDISQTQEQMWNVLSGFNNISAQSFLVTRLVSGNEIVNDVVNLQSKEFVSHSYYGAGFTKLTKIDDNAYQYVEAIDENHDGHIEDYEIQNGTYDSLNETYGFNYLFENGNLAKCMMLDGSISMKYQELMVSINQLPNAQLIITKKDDVYTCLMSVGLTRSLEIVYTDSEIKKIEQIENNYIDIYEVVYDIDKIIAAIDSFVVPQQN